MNREQAIELARKHAAAQPQSYFKSEGFKPHEWVISAIIAAYDEGKQAERANLSAPPGQVVD